MIVEVAIASGCLLLCVALRTSVQLVKLAQEVEETSDPALIASKRASLQKRREALQATKTKIFRDAGCLSSSERDYVTKLDADLRAIADEEAKLPILDEET